MKKKTHFNLVSLRIILTLLLSLSVGNFCQAQSWQWAASMGNTGASANTAPDEKVNDMAVDQWGNVYVIGDIWQGGLIGGQPVPYWGVYSTGFIAKYDCQGDLVWVKTFGSISIAHGEQLEIDPSGNVYFTGLLFGSAMPGGEVHFLDSLISQDINGFFISKIDSSGALQWIRISESGSGMMISSTQGLAQDENHNLVALISVGPSGELFPGHLCPTRGTYVFKFDTLGNVLSSGFLTELIQGGWYWSTAVDQSNNMYLSLKFEDDTLLFGGQQIIRQGTAQFELLFIKVDSLYNTQWYEQMGDTIYSGLGYGVVVDSMNNVFFSGLVMNGRILQGHTFTNSLAANAYISSDFVAKFNSAGTLIWADNVDVQWGSNGFGKLAMDNISGKLFFSGVYGGQAQFGATSITSLNLDDYYLAEVNPAGYIQSAVTFPSTGNYPYSSPSITEVDNAGNVYIGGSFNGAITINGVTHTNQGGRSNGFIAKYGNVCTSGIEEEQLISESDELLVYPNPAGELVMIQIPDLLTDAEILITDVAGREVRRITNESGQGRTISLKVADLPSGIYFVLVNGDDELFSAKFIKQ